MQVPIIKGFKTQEIIAGNRLVMEDLQQLDIIIEIIEVAKNNGIKDIINAINITEESKFILEIPSENKTVQFGDGSNINVKILWIIKLIEKEKGVTGEIVVDVKDIKEVYFRF